MKFEQIQNNWKKEMGTMSTLQTFSLQKLASESRKNHWQCRFIAGLLTCIAVFQLWLFWFIRHYANFTVPLTIYIVFPGGAAICLYFAWWHFQASRDTNSLDRTLGEWIRLERKRVNKQIRLYTTGITQFALASFAVSLPGLMVNYPENIGLGPFWQGIMTITAVSLSVIGLFYLFVKWLMREKYGPVLERLRRLEHQLQED